MERTRKERVLTAADIMYAHSRLTDELLQEYANADVNTRTVIIRQRMGAERLTEILLNMLVENEVSE